MIIQMNNKDEKFYQYMGKFFGSRLVERQTNDRVYDDDKKEWYMYIEEKKVQAFVSLNQNIIKNIYTTKDVYLEKILEEIKKKNNIGHSIVTNYYIDIYEKCGFKVDKNKVYKNFVTIYTEEVVKTKERSNLK